jgi:hypothetical protein
MKDEMPEYFAGFDLVGQEDKGSPLLTFLPQLLDASDKGIKFFFHAGETGKIYRLFTYMQPINSKVVFVLN